MSGVVVKSVDETAVRRAMDAYAARLLLAHPEIKEIVVFGSFAEGTWAPGSDLDIVANWGREHGAGPTGYLPETIPALSSTVVSAKIGAFARSARAIASLGAASTATSWFSVARTILAK